MDHHEKGTNAQTTLINKSDSYFLSLPEHKLGYGWLPQFTNQFTISFFQFKLLFKNIFGVKDILQTMDKIPFAEIFQREGIKFQIIRRELTKAKKVKEEKN